MGAALRDLRERSELTGKALAAKLGWSQSRISKIEIGMITPSFENVVAITKALGAPLDAAEPLMNEAKRLSAQKRTWRRWRPRDVLHHQKRIRELETTSSRVCNLQISNIPGLLQTAEYARQVFLRVDPDLTTDELDASVARRMERQAALFDTSKRLQFAMTEAVLRLRITSKVAMLAQLDRLISLVALEHVKIGVVPAIAQVEAIPYGSMIIYDNRAVMFETTSAELILEDDDDVAMHVELYERFMSAALTGSDAATFLRRLFEDVSATWDE